MRRSTLLAKGGSEVPVEKTLHSATSGADRRPSVITLARDITARLAAEAQLRQSQDALHEAERVLAVAEDRERIARGLQGAAASAPGELRGRLLQVVTEATGGLGFEPRLQFDGPIETMDVHIADHLVPVLREALSSIAQHAQAGHVRVTVSVADDVTLTVSDDAVGVPAEVLGGLGLINMAERARDLGGGSAISPQPSGGSLLTWQVPVRRSPQPA